jgi:hypothetical protein
MQVNHRVADYEALTQQEKLKADRRRVQRTSTLLVDSKSSELKTYLKDPTVLHAYKTLERDDDISTVFIDLYQHAQVRNPYEQSNSVIMLTLFLCAER